MGNLPDMSGPFDPNFKPSDLTSEALEKLLIMAGQLYLGADGMWTTVIRKRYGDDVALSCSKEVWDTNWRHEIDRPRKWANIQGDDIAAMFKCWQVDPGFAAMFDIDFWISEDGKRGKLTVTRCRTLEYCERHNDTWLQNLACNELDGPLIPRSAEYVNPKIKCKATKLPPRKSPDEIPCEWEFWMED